MKLIHKKVLICVLIVSSIYLCYSRMTETLVNKKEDVIVYGSLSCPYTVEQRAHFGNDNHTFKDCDKGECTEKKITSFPTTIIGGVTHVGLNKSL